MLLSYYQKNTIEAGCDEAGRGCLAGPVFAAAVILPPHFKNKRLNDSKKINEANRNALRKIIEKEALAWAVAKVDPEEIDKINILNASFEAMHRAIAQLRTIPECLLIDGNRFKKHENIPHHCIIKGDGKYMSIAAASILAKTHRDEFMRKKHLEYPQYMWSKNKGYPTIEHRNAIVQIGSCKFHRQSFRLLPVPEQGELLLE